MTLDEKVLYDELVAYRGNRFYILCKGWYILRILYGPKDKDIEALWTNYEGKPNIASFVMELEKEHGLEALEAFPPSNLKIVLDQYPVWIQIKEIEGDYIGSIEPI